MSEPKPFASLSSGLLARKGSARPAMRPQGLGGFGGGSMEDLGWNDMGYSPAPKPVVASPFEAAPREHLPSPIAALTPMSGAVSDENDFEPGPPVVEQQRAAIAARFAEPAAEPAEEHFVLATKAKKVAEQTPGPQQEQADESYLDEVTQEEVAPVFAAVPREVPKAVQHSARAKAAFTLRLEAERHLKLRLACAVTGRSAQQLVTEALDRLLESRPEIEALAEQVPVAGKAN